MVKEKIKTALEDAVRYYNDGMSANDAIIKSSEEHDLTVDQTDRVVESFNTAKTINYFDKNAGDRTGKFDLASKDAVTLKLFGSNSREVSKSRSSSEKSASIHTSLLDDFYFSSPDRSHNRKNIFAEKRASLLDVMSKLAEEKWAHGYSDNTIGGMASDAYSTVKSAEKDIDSALGTIDSYLWTATEKIARDLSRGSYDIPEDRANLFKVACPHKLVIDEVSKFSPLLKAATGGQYVRTPVVDTEPVDDLLKEAEDIMMAVRHRGILRQKKAEFHEKAAKIKKAMLSDPSMSGIISSNSTPDSMIHRPRESVKKAQSVTPPREFVDNLITVKSRKDNNETLRDETRGAILADLLSSDPILQDADPRQVASIYKSLIASSPRVSLNKEVVRSVLRGAVNSIAISPNDTKVLTDVDKGINYAYGNTQETYE